VRAFYGAVRDLEFDGTPEAKRLIKVIAAYASDVNLARTGRTPLERLDRRRSP
jgi:hypothetical protein